MYRFCSHSISEAQLQVELFANAANELGYKHCLGACHLEGVTINVGTKGLNLCVNIHSMYYLWIIAIMIFSMAETAVHPRPQFSTFLQSDASAGGDALSYYRHKQYLRKNKTAILQARAGNLPTTQKLSEVKGKQAINKLSPSTQRSLTSVKFEEPATVGEVRLN